MKVYSYFEEIGGGDNKELINLWIDSWKSHGWTPVMLDDRTASCHKDWVAFNSGRIHCFPTRNPLAYERACWRRWLAFDVVGGGVMVDFDVMNVGLKPEEVILGPVLILEQHRVPCAVASDGKGASEIVHHMMTHVPQPRDGHYSDMLMFIDNNKWPHIKICKEPDQGNRKEAKMIHFSARSSREMGARNKCDAIYKIL